MLKRLEGFGSGYRTYLVAAVMVVLSGLKSQGYLDEQTYDLVFNTLMGLGLVTLRAGMSVRRGR